MQDNLFPLLVMESMTIIWNSLYQLLAILNMLFINTLTIQFDGISKQNGIWSAFLIWVNTCCLYFHTDILSYFRKLIFLQSLMTLSKISEYTTAEKVFLFINIDRLRNNEEWINIPLYFTVLQVGFVFDCKTQSVK